MGKSGMKKWLALLFALAALAALVIGCGWLDLLTIHPQSANSPESGKAAALTVRVVPNEGAAVYDLAASVTVNETLLGSRSGEKKSVPPGTNQADAFDFVLQDGDLPAGPLSTLRLDFFAAEKAGADYAPCGGAVIHDPTVGSVYSLTLHGDFASGLCVALDETTADTAIELFDAGI